MPQQEIDFESSYDRPRSSYAGYEGQPYYQGIPPDPEQKIPLTNMTLKPPLSQRLLFGLISLMIWLFLNAFGLISYLGNPMDSPNLRIFLFLTILFFTICLIIINVIFCRTGLLWTRNRL